MRKVLMTLAVAILVALGQGTAFAQEGAAGGSDGLIALAAGLGIGIAAVGAGLGQGRAVAAAMESIGRNPNAWRCPRRRIAAGSRPGAKAPPGA